MIFTTTPTLLPAPTPLFTLLTRLLPPSSSFLTRFLTAPITVCDVMGEIDMDGPKDEEGRILDPEFYPVLTNY